MLSFRTSLIALALSGLVAGPAAAKEVCYFGVCKDVPSAPADPTPAPATTPATTTSQTPGGLKVLASFGNWQVIADAHGNRAIIDTFDDGSKLLITKENGEYEIVIREPTWHLRDGNSPDIKVDIDGVTFTGTSNVVDAQTVAIHHLTAKFVKSFYHGEHAKIEIDDDSWSFGLADAANAIDAAAGLEPSTTS